MDVIAHKPDMPWAPGVSQYLGLGLWTNIPATMIVEGGLWVIAILVFLRTIRWRKRLALLVFWPVILLVTLIFYNNVAGPPPPNPQTAPVVSLVYFSLVVAWAYWVNRLCVVR
jgi:hypothetical protein